MGGACLMSRVREGKRGIIRESRNIKGPQDQKSENTGLLAFHEVYKVGAGCGKDDDISNGCLTKYFPDEQSKCCQ